MQGIHVCLQQMAQFAPNLPVFWGHGTTDNEIPLEMGTECVQFLKSGLGIPEDKLVILSLNPQVQLLTKFRVTMKTYDGLGHTVNHQEASDLADWLRDILV